MAQQRWKREHQEVNKAYDRGSARQLASVLVIVLIFGIIIWFVNSNRHPAAPPIPGVPPKELAGISELGMGGDPMLNQKKNRYTAPASVEDVTVNQVIGIPSDVIDKAGKKNRSKWSFSQLTYLNQQEARGLRVTGYLVRAKESGPEACNGGIDSLRDYHVWISDDPYGVKAGAMIVEVTPRWKIAHPEWRLRYIQKLADQHAKVRVTGWLMWDEEHASEVEKSRATQWEVHPVTKFEVWNGGAWQPLGLDQPS